MINFFSRPQISTNFIYLLPIGIALGRGYILESVVLGLAMIASLVYHSFANKIDLQWFFLRDGVSWPEYIAGVFDYILGATVAVIYVRRLWHSDISGFTLILFLLLCLFGFMIFMGPRYFSFLQRWSVTTTHSAWHIISGLIAIMALTQ